MRTKQWITGALVAAGVFAAGQLPVAGQQLDLGSVKQPDMTPRLNLGKLNYDAYCAECHGASTAGSDKGPTFLHRVYHPGHHGDRAFMVAPKQGAKAHHWQFGDMKPVEGVNDEQLKTIIDYVRAVQKVNGLF